MVDVFACRLIPEDEFIKIKPGILDQLESGLRYKIEQFVREDDAQRSLIGELLIRSTLVKMFAIPTETIRIAYSSKGKPFLHEGEHIKFNVSHSGQWVVAAFGPKRIGIDIEEIKPGKMKIAKRYFTETEVYDLLQKPENEQSDYFFELWTCKESYLKALGKGLTKSLGSFSVKKIDGRMMIFSGKSKENIHLKQYHIDKDYKLAVCSADPGFGKQIQLISFDQILETLEIKI